MTKEELRALIASDTQAAALATAGDDAGCAARCAAIAPKELLPSVLVTELTMFNYFTPQDAEAIIQQMEAVAGSNAVVKRVLKWFYPPAQGINFAHPTVRALLVTPTNQGGLGFTAQQVAPLLAAGEVEPTITADQVSEAMAGERVTFRDESTPEWAPQEGGN